MYEVGMLNESSQKLYYLIERYKDKVSDRLLKQQKELRKVGKQVLRDYVNEILTKPNPFLQSFNASGHYYPVPIVYGKTND